MARVAAGDLDCTDLQGPLGHGRMDLAPFAGPRHGSERPWRTRLRAPPCLRACRSPIPRTLVPARPMSKGAAGRRRHGGAIATAGVLCRRQGVERSGTGRSSPAGFGKARDEARRLATRQAGQDLGCQAGPDRGGAADRLAAALARWRRVPGRRRIEPDGQRSTRTQRRVAGGPATELSSSRDRSPVCVYANRRRLSKRPTRGDFISRSGAGDCGGQGARISAGVW